MKPGVAARLHASAIVAQVLDEGAHSNLLLDRDLPLRPVERASTHRLVMDTLRWLVWTDQVLAGASRVPIADLDPEVRSALRVGITELLLGGDAHGVVDSTVEAVRKGGAGRAAGFVNAVLRTVTRTEQPIPDPAAAVGAPVWIRDRLAAQWSTEEADAFLGATLEPAPIMVRVRPGETLPVGEPVEGIVGAWVVPTRADVARHMVMDAASTAAALAVGAGPGDAVLDVAAAPGNKTLALVDAMEGGGFLVATDRNPERVAVARRRLVAAGAEVSWVVADGTMAPFSAGSFDRILLDAPCTGLGTLRRRPEIKLRLDEDSPGRMAELQRRLVTASLPLLRPGGRLVYSVCTVFAEETTAIATEFGGRPPHGLPGRVWGGGLLLAPHLTASDGMFITLLGG